MEADGSKIILVSFGFLWWKSHHFTPRDQSLVKETKIILLSSASICFRRTHVKPVFCLFFRGLSPTETDGSRWKQNYIGFFWVPLVEITSFHTPGPVSSQRNQNNFAFICFHLLPSDSREASFLSFF